MRTIRLTHGAGNGIDKACLITASNMLIGKPEDLDNNNCVDLDIQTFIVRTNDFIPEDILGEIYGPLLWEILGTNTDDPDIIWKRRACFVNWVIHEFWPPILKEFYGPKIAGLMENIPPITDANSLEIARRKIYELVDMMVITKDSIYSFCSLEQIGPYRLIKYQLEYLLFTFNIDNNILTTAIANNITHMSWVLSTHSAHYDDKQFWQQCVDVIRKVLSIGDKRPIEAVITEEDLVGALSRGEQ